VVVVPSSSAVKLLISSVAIFIIASAKPRHFSSRVARRIFLRHIELMRPFGEHVARFSIPQRLSLAFLASRYEKPFFPAVAFQSPLLSLKLRSQPSSKALERGTSGLRSLEIAP